MSLCQALACLLRTFGLWHLPSWARQLRSRRERMVYKYYWIIYLDIKWEYSTFMMCRVLSMMRHWVLLSCVCLYISLHLRIRQSQLNVICTGRAWAGAAELQKWFVRSKNNLDEGQSVDQCLVFTWGGINRHHGHAWPWPSPQGGQKITYRYI